MYQTVLMDISQIDQHNCQIGEQMADDWNDERIIAMTQISPQAANSENNQCKNDRIYPWEQIDGGEQMVGTVEKRSYKNYCNDVDMLFELGKNISTPVHFFQYRIRHNHDQQK